MLHHFKHELQCHALMLLGWCVLLALHLFLFGSRFVEEHTAAGGHYGAGLLTLVVTAVILLPLLLVLLIVQGDAPLDEHAFWFTRPVRGKTLCGAKLLLVGLFFIALPLGVEMAIIGWRGGGSRMGLAVPDFLLLRGAVTCLAFAAGTLAPRMLHAVAAVFALSILGVLCLLAFVLLGGADLLRFPPYLLPTRVLLFGLIAGTGGLCTALIMFQRRSVAWGSALAAATVALATFAMIAWPWDLLGFGRSLEKPDVSWKLNASVEVSISESRAGLRLGSVTVPVETDGKPDNVAMPVLFEKGTLVPDAGRGRTITVRQTGRLDPMGRPERTNIRGLFQGYTFGGKAVPFYVLNSFPQRFGGKPLRALVESQSCETSLHGTAGWFTFEVAGQLPLRTGAKWEERGEEIEIALAEATDDGFRLGLETRELRQLFDRERCAVAAESPWAFVIVHPGAKQALWFDPNQTRNHSGLAGLSPLRSSFLRAEINLQSEFGVADEPSWLDEARLVIVRPVYHGVIDWKTAPATLPLYLR